MIWKSPTSNVGMFQPSTGRVRHNKSAFYHVLYGPANALRFVCVWPENNFEIK